MPARIIQRLWNMKSAIAELILIGVAELPHGKGNGDDLEPSRPFLPDILALHGKWRSNKAAIIHPHGVASWHVFVEATHRVGETAC